MIDLINNQTFQPYSPYPGSREQVTGRYGWIVILPNLALIHRE
ncbi:hypothetical protein [Legionella tucsonensis]|nr:hypothetical protein [Legionella tucsonensis]